MELLGLRNRLAVSIGNVEVDIAPDASCEARAEDRIQADRQLNGGAKVIQARHHIGQRRRTGGMPDQNDGLRPPALVFRRGFLRERWPRKVVGYGNLDALLLQLGRDVIQAQGKDIEHAAEKINVST